MSLTPLAELIRQRGGELRSPVEPPFLDYSVPQDYALFLREHDGTSGMDSAGWCFWGWSEFQTIDSIRDTETAPNSEPLHSIPPEYQEPRAFIIFADHFIHAGYLCFRV